MEIDMVPLDLRNRATELGLCIVTERGDGELDCGPFFLIDAEGYHVWDGGLPLEGIADALTCFAYELAGTPAEQAWRDFGVGWEITST
jgi:hypothetical protein